MSCILYYSNFCEKSKHLLNQLGKSSIRKEIHFVCIDKRFRNEQNGNMYVVLENQQNLVLPPQVSKVPALLLLKEGNRVIFGNEITQKLNPVDERINQQAVKHNGEPSAFSIDHDNIGGFGVASDSFSFWDQDSDELLAKGNGGLRQMYNYASIDYESTITTPPDDYTPNKIDDASISNMESQRTQDLNIAPKR
jgi:hypothetical protein